MSRRRRSVPVGRRNIRPRYQPDGGDYVLALKENWPATYAEVAQAFADPAADLNIQRSQTVDADHGRIETRRHAICQEVDWLFSDRRHPDEFGFPGLVTIGMVESETERNSTIEREKRFDLCSTPLDVETFAAATGDREPAALGAGRRVP